MHTLLGWEMGVLRLIINKTYLLLSKEITVLCGRERSTEIRQKGERGA